MCTHLSKGKFFPSFYKTFYKHHAIKQNRNGATFGFDTYNNHMEG
jgi:hypothetical protein